MAAPVIDFQSVRGDFSASVENSIEGNLFNRIENTFKEAQGSDGEKKLTLDQAFRDVLQQQVKANCECQLYKDTITLATACVTKELCSSSTPFLMMSDLLDCLPLEKCADIFTYVEERVTTWKSDQFYTSGKNYLLRMCNDLLRRMSQSQNTLFCGRIQMFLARLFPLSEKSGLNLMSVFNLENTTLFGTTPEEYSRLRSESQDGMKEEEKVEDMEEGETDDQTIPVDYNLYKKFWSLQDYFRKPTQCYEKGKWKEFVNFSSEVLGCFDSYKLDDLKTSENKMDKIVQSEEHPYFAKYLTSEKLLDLQLSDSSFRRYVLVQFLVLFQYLGAQVKFKSSTQALGDEQTAWTKKTTEKVYHLLRETPPEGNKFAKAIEHTLSREENWNSWKNQGCPSYVRQKLETTAASVTQPFTRKRSLGDDLKASEGKIIKMGSSELTRLWNLNPDNMAACRSEKRNFVPKLDTYFEDAILQADPEQQVEEEYKLVNNETWSWKALRLLSRSSMYFFVPSATNLKMTLREYMDIVLGKLKKDMPGSNQNSTEVTADMGADVMTTQDQADENIDKADEPAPPAAPAVALVTTEQMEKLAELCGSNWKKLATEFGFSEDETTYIETENPEVKVQGVKLLKLWAENEGDKATAPTLKVAMKEIGLESEFVDVFGNVDL